MAKLRKTDFRARYRTCDLETLARRVISRPRKTVPFEVTAYNEIKPRKLRGTALNRGRRDFSERDRLLLTLVQLQLIQVYRNADTLTRVHNELTLFRQTLEWLNRGVMVLTRDGRVPANARFRRRVEKCFSSTKNSIAATEPESLETFGLSRRQSEVLIWVTRGKTNAEIGKILGTSPRTVGKHLERIYTKLGVETRTAAAVRAVNANMPESHSS